MKTLYLLRHAKSSWQQPELNDMDRPLLEKGLKRSKLIIDYLIDKKIKVDLIISSPALRALKTAEIFAHALRYPIDQVLIEKKVYSGDEDALMELFFDISPRINSLMIVGHNPTLTNFANYFLDPHIDYLPTSGVVSIGFKTEKWEKIYTAERKTNFVVYPKMFRAD